VALAQIVAAQRNYMEPDMELYKTWIEYLTPAAGCNTTALAECMVEEDYS